MDRAQDQEQAARDAALQATLARIAAAHAPRDARVDETCIDCDEPIEPERLAALRKTARCATCAHEYERRLACSR